MPYEILKGARPPRYHVRLHYALTREMVEARIPVVANLPHIESQIPLIPGGSPTIPSGIWNHMIYPYDIAMKAIGIVRGQANYGEERTLAAGYSGKPGAGYSAGYPRVLSK